jgi:hypothetical protein
MSTVRLGKHDYKWFAEEDLLRQVPKPPKQFTLCLNWSQCKKEEPTKQKSLPPPPDATTTTTTSSTATVSTNSASAISSSPTNSTTNTTTNTSTEAKLTTNPTTFKRCGGCGAKYCCRECQVTDWRAGHKKICSTLKLLSTNPSKFNETQRRPMIQKIIHEYRIYLCPFAVCKYNTQGRGFLLITSIDNSVNDFIYTKNVNLNGQLLDRRIELEYLDLGEFAELCTSDFELGVIRNGLVSAVETYDPQQQIVVLWLAACGFLGVLTVPIVPDFRVCQALGADHAQKRTIQLALDVMDEEGEAEAAQAEMMAETCGKGLG